MGKSFGIIQEEARVSISSPIGGLSDFLVPDTVIDSGSVEKNINGNGKLSLSWKSMDYSVLAQGTVVSIDGFGEYVLKDNYIPSRGSGGIYIYSPSFVSKDSEIGQGLYYKEVETADGEPLWLYTFPYSGQAGTLVADLNSFGTPVELGSGFAERMINISLDGDSVKSVCQKVASALGTNMMIVNGNIQIGMNNVLAAEEHYERFVILGGTRNMGKVALRNGGGVGYAAVTQRLTLPAEYPHSIYPASLADAKGVPTKILIFDDIYPKMELRIASARERVCYVYDEDGDRVVDHFEGGDGIPATRETESGIVCYKDKDGNVLTPVYKKYAKWYITLALNDEAGSAYTFKKASLINGKPLGLVFQSGILTGREFDLSYYDENRTDLEDDDVDANGFNALAGEYRIIMQADGSTLLPSLSSEGLCPQTGDVVTLTGIALDSAYKALARQELLRQGIAMAGMYISAGSRTPSFETETTWPDFLEDASLPASVRKMAPRLQQSVREELGAAKGEYVITSIKEDLVSKERSVSFGTFQPQGLLSTIVDKLETISVSGGGATMGELNDDYVRNTAPVGIDQFMALLRAGGALGFKAISERVQQTNENLGDLQDEFDEAQQQNDRNFKVFYGTGTPKPILDDNSMTYPTTEWAPADYQEHVKDVFVDMRGNHVWQWLCEKVATNGSVVKKYYWRDITGDGTAEMLLQIRDIASDGRISGGSEKTALLIDWLKVLDTYAANLKSWEMYEIDADETWSAYFNSILSLYAILNNGNKLESYEVEDTDDEGTVTGTHVEYADLTDTSNYMPLWLQPSALGLTATVPDVAAYRAAWATYYAALTTVESAINSALRLSGDEALKKLADIVDDDVLTVIEKQEVVREWESVSKEFGDFANRTERAHLSDSYAWSTYEAAYYALGTYMNGGTLWYGATTPLWFGSRKDHDETAGTGFCGSVFKQRWQSYYDARSTLSMAISTRSNSYFVGIGVPNPPYYEGDMWLKLHAANDNVGTLMLCIRDNTGYYGDESDWRNFSTVARDPLEAIASLAEAYCTFASPSETVTLSSSTNGSTAVETAAADVASMLGSGFRIQLHVSNSAPTGEMYDVWATRITFTPVADQTAMTGGWDIYVHDGERWRMMRKSTAAVVENLGNAIRMAVFGRVDGTLQGSGLVFEKDFGQFFSSWMSQEGNEFRAELDLYVKKDKNGVIQSGVKISADEILIDGKDIDFTAAKSISLNAGDITFTGQTLINGKFSIDTEGNATMDGLKATNATITGLKATNANITGSVTIPTSGKFSYNNGNFGFFMDADTAFTSKRTDYLYGYAERGALLRIQQLTSASLSASYRGIFCDAEVEVQGVTQLLRTAGSKDDTSIAALIVEGVDNKNWLKTVGVINKGRRVRNVRAVSGNVTVGTDDDVLLLTGSGDRTVMLPSDPEEGREIWMCKAISSGTVTVSSSKNMVGDGPTSFQAASKWHIYIFRNNTWYYGYTN